MVSKSVKIVAHARVPTSTTSFIFWLCKVLGQLSLAENPILINQKNIFFFRLLLLIGVHAEELSIL